MSSEKRYDIDVSRYEGHTEGPWIETVVSVTTAELNGEARKHIVFRPSDYHSNAADLRLIADAPNLLAAYQAQAKRIAELEDILAEVTNELQYMYESYHSHIRERDRKADEELIQRAREAIGKNDGA